MVQNSASWHWSHVPPLAASGPGPSIACCHFLLTRSHPKVSQALSLSTKETKNQNEPYLQELELKCADNPDLG